MGEASREVRNCFLYDATRLTPPTCVDDVLILDPCLVTCFYVFETLDCVLSSCTAKDASGQVASSSRRLTIRWLDDERESRRRSCSGTEG